MKAKKIFRALRGLIGATRLYALLSAAFISAPIYSARPIVHSWLRHWIEQGQEIGQPYPYPYRMHMMSRYKSVKCAARDIIHWHDSTAVNRQL